MLTDEEQTYFDTEIARIVAPYMHQEGQPQAYTAEGEIYEQIYSWPAVPEDHAAEVMFLTLAAAVRGWEVNFRAYMGVNTHIVWRLHPEAEKSNHIWEHLPMEPLMRNRSIYKVRARLYGRP